MGSSQLETKKAVECGYWAMYRFNPALKEKGENPFVLDSKEPSADFHEFLMGEVRYASLKKQYPDTAEALFAKTKADAMERLGNYKRLAGKE
ncbi:Pyruvate synthase [bioreactor metagenome]|uniref:Pyruvate synthase n=1 Tax=bioreactor metagenome TaxID=1076179 RepID=A0A645CF28_9ZZZZ